MKLDKRTLLAIGSFVGLAASVFCSVKDSFKAKDILDEKKPEGLIDTFKAVAPCYISTAVTVTATTVCIAKGYSVGTAQIATATATATGFSAAVLDRYHAYQKVVRDEFGAEKEQEIYEKAVVMNVNKDHTIFPQLPCDMNGESNNVLFHDMETDIWFRSSVEKVQQAIYHLNRNFQGRGVIFGYEWYDFLGVPLPYDTNEKMMRRGWSINQIIDYGYEIVWIDLFMNYVAKPGKEPYYDLYFDISPNEEAVEECLE